MNYRKISFPLHHGKQTQDHPNFGRRVFLKGIGIACLGFASFLQACDHLISGKENTEAVAKTSSIPKAMRPPMDAAAPAKTETATFALG